MQKRMWVLPDRDQTGVHEVVYEGLRQRLDKLLDVSSLPPELTLGVPEQLIRKYGIDDPIYSQLIRERSRKLFQISVCCGKDRDGRITHLSQLTILGIADMLDTAWVETGLPVDVEEHVRTIERRFTGRSDQWVRWTKEMLQKARSDSSIRYLANVNVPMEHFRPDWTPQRAMRGSPTRIVIFAGLAVAAAAGLYIVSRASESAVAPQAGPATQTTRHLGTDGE